MTHLQKTCVMLSRADAALMHVFHSRAAMRAQPAFATPQNRMGMAALHNEASQVLNGTRFTGQRFAAANDNTMAVGVA